MGKSKVTWNNDFTWHPYSNDSTTTPPPFVTHYSPAVTHCGAPSDQVSWSALQVNVAAPWRVYPSLQTTFRVSPGPAAVLIVLECSTVMALQFTKKQLGFGMRFYRDFRTRHAGQIRKEKGVNTLKPWITREMVSAIRPVNQFAM